MQSDLFDIDGASPTDASQSASLDTFEESSLEGLVFDGNMSKMRVQLTKPVTYSIGNLKVNSLIGTRIKLIFKGAIECISCGAQTNKSLSLIHISAPTRPY